MSETLRTSETLDDVVLFMKISVTSVFEFEGADLTDLYHLKSRKNCFQWSQDLNYLFQTWTLGIGAMCVYLSLSRDKVEYMDIAPLSIGQVWYKI